MDEDPPLAPQPGTDTSSQDGQPQAEGADDRIDHSAREHLRNAPTHIHNFGGCAGKPTVTPEILVSGYHGYASRVSGSTNNPYAPFNNHLDWEIARWGKLRGLVPCRSQNSFRYREYVPFNFLYVNTSGSDQYIGC